MKKTSRKNPQRGGPGFLLCCETGREVKCQREALDIIGHHYFQIPSRKATKKGSDELKDREVLTLDQEIALLKKGASTDIVLHSSERIKIDDHNYKNPFQVYETGCRGTVFLMYVKPKNNQSEKEGTGVQEGGGLDCDDFDVRKGKRIANHGGCDGETKKRKVDNSESISNEKLDPVVIARSIMDNLMKNDELTPRSRFVTRMIPIQLTCFASMEEIISTSRKLIKKFLLPFGIDARNSKKERPTFKIDLKRRICSSIRRDEVVTAVADSIKILTDEYWKSCVKDESDRIQQVHEDSLFRVDLSNPDYTVLVDICRTLVCMSVVKDATWFRNFNLTRIEKEEL